MWFTTAVPGYQEMADFQKRLTQKLSWVPGSNPLPMGPPEIAKGMAEVYREMAKLQGLPIYQVIRINTAATPAADSGPLLETTVEMSNFSSASQDTAKFEVPAGFQQVESEMSRQGR
jgi:hypothetical protein